MDTLKGLSVLRYILGLSYQGDADLLDALQTPLAKSTVYDNVQAAGQHAIQLREQWLRQQAGKVKVIGLDFTHVNYQRAGSDCRGGDRRTHGTAAYL